MANYDFSKVTNYLDRQMFLDKAGPVTIQRFEEVAYPRIQKFEELARACFWNPEEISLTKDKSDLKKADKATEFAYSQTLLRQTTLDSVQGRAPSQVFIPVCSVPELEALVLNWSFFETNIHSNTYSHIIRNVYNVPKDQFNTIHENQHIIDMAANIGKYYDDLHQLNCKKELGIYVSEKEHIRAIWLALNASFFLESIRFISSFAFSFSLVENGIFLGNGNLISLIMADEILHMDWTAYIINQVVKDDDRFAKAKVECEDVVYAMCEDVVREEKEWAKHIFTHGPIVGLNEQILCTFVDEMATTRLKMIGIKHKNPVKSGTLPWFNKHLNISKKQVSLQEQESSAYLIGAMTTDVNLEELPEL